MVVVYFPALKVHKEFFKKPCKILKELFKNSCQILHEFLVKSWLILKDVLKNFRVEKQAATPVKSPYFPEDSHILRARI